MEGPGVAGAGISADAMFAEAGCNFPGPCMAVEMLGSNTATGRGYHCELHSDNGCTNVTDAGWSVDETASETIDGAGDMGAWFGATGEAVSEHVETIVAEECRSCVVVWVYACIGSMSMIYVVAHFLGSL